MFLLHNCGVNFVIFAFRKKIKTNFSKGKSHIAGREAFRKQLLRDDANYDLENSDPRNVSETLSRLSTYQRVY